MSATKSTAAFRIELARTLPDGRSYTLYVCEQRTAWDGGWHTNHVERAKTWKTAAGAQRWLTERSAVEGGTVVPVPDSLGEMRAQLVALAGK